MRKENPTRYLPTVNVWEPAVDRALRSGALRLQPGQWVSCGDIPFHTRHRSRFSHVTEGGGIIVAFHYPDAVAKFKAYRADRRGR